MAVELGPAPPTSIKGNNDDDFGPRVRRMRNRAQCRSFQPRFEQQATKFLKWQLFPSLFAFGWNFVRPQSVEVRKSVPQIKGVSVPPFRAWARLTDGQIPLRRLVCVPRAHSYSLGPATLLPCCVLALLRHRSHVRVVCSGPYTRYTLHCHPKSDSFRPQRMQTGCTAKGLVPGLGDY